MPPDDRPPPFVTGPASAEEIERLLHVVEERVRLRPAPPAAPPMPAPDADVLDPAAAFGGESLGAFAAPLFHVEKGGGLVRAAKALANVPLGILGRPQAYFNAAVRRVIAAWADVLGATLDNLAALQREVAAQRARLAELEARLARLEGRDGAPPPS